MNRYLLVVVFLSVSLTTMGQSFLVLEKLGSKKRFVFHPESRLDVKIKDDDFYTRISIVGFEDSAIVTEKQVIKIEDIREVHFIKESGFIGMAGPTLVTAGIILFSSDFLNQTVVQGGEYGFSDGVAIVSGSLVGLGGIFLLAKSKSQYKLKNRWRIRVARVY